MMSNDMTSLMNTLENRLHMKMLYRHLPQELKKEAWIDVVENQTMKTFSRYFPHKVRFTVNDDTCNRRRENGKMVYYIKDEFLGNVELLGVEDLDWSDTSGDNLAVGQTVGYGVFRPQYAAIGDTMETFSGYQLMADNTSLYNNNIYLDFEYPNKIILSRVGNVHIVLSSFVINLLVKHSTLATISPTKMESFEKLAAADVAEFLYGNLKYLDKQELTYINIDLLLDNLQGIAESRPSVIEEFENAYVTAANDNIPYIMTVNG